MADHHVDISATGKGVRGKWQHTSSKGMIWRFHISLLLISYWLKLRRISGQSCKRCWEIQSLFMITMVPDKNSITSDKRKTDIGEYYFSYPSHVCLTTGFLNTWLFKFIILLCSSIFFSCSYIWIKSSVKTWIFPSLIGLCQITFSSKFCYVLDILLLLLLSLWQYLCSLFGTNCLCCH